MIGSSASIKSNGVRTNGDLFPVHAIADGETRHRASAASRQMDNATRKLRRRHTSRDCSRDVGESGKLDLLTSAKLFKTTRNIFAHKIVN